ncbi:MAG: tRNA preQ1(34) S-adenosylmethionine ribosyltransferase-isomerase QueA [Pseudomonadota bacterium]
MKLSDFDFDLPEQLIATRPARPRSSSRMLVATPNTLTDAQTIDLPNFLRAGDRLVLNDTRVIPARLSGIRQRGDGYARIEATLLEPQADGTWSALLKPLKKVKVGETVAFGDRLSATLEGRSDGFASLRFNLVGEAFEAVLAEAGAMPLPPYIESKRKADVQDHQDYQTVWARQTGAVAAPTASLHFDEALLSALERQGITQSFVTLHVGAGTFLPVKVDDIRDHKMHAERGIISAEAAEQMNATRAAGGRLVAVGTTSMRLLETATSENGTVEAWQGATDIFIRPGYHFKACDALMTNFHLPKSTLMMLVSAFIGRERTREIYAHAIRERYRFFSYGDASLLMPNKTLNTAR